MTTETSQHEMAGLTGAATAMIAGGAKNLGQLLSVPVEFKLLTIAHDIASVPEASAGGIDLNVEFTGAVTGDSWIVLEAQDAKSIAGLMPQGTDVSESDLLGEAGMSALAEAIHQVMAGAVAALSDGLGERVEVSAPRLVTDPESQPARTNTVFVTYEVEIADEAKPKVIWQIDAGLAENLGTRWIDATAAASPAQPPSPAPVAAAAPTSPVGGGVIDSVEVDVAVELGNVAMTIGDLLHMGEGSVVTLSQSVGDDVTMLANGTPVASGEVVVVNGTLGFRVTDLITEASGA
jgi:flagellar motor switch protein FliN/FliY